MAKGYSFTDYSQPTGCSASAVAGGSLSASTTYYYRILKVSPYANADYFYGKSEISDQFSVTTDATNKTARITFSSTFETGCSYRIYRSTSSTAIGTPYLAHLDFYPDDDTYNASGTVTFDDDGTAGTWGNNFAEITDKAHGRLTLSGSTTSDRFSIVDLYEADQAAGWGVIQRLDVNTYKVNCYLIGHTGLYWEDTEKTIIFADGADFYYSDSYFYFGAISGSNRTSQGCNIIVTSSWLTTLIFPYLYAYRTTFTYIYPVSAGGWLGLTGGGFYNGILQDCCIDKWRSFYPYGSSNCTFNNVIFSRYDNAFSAYGANFNVLKMLSGSRVWQISGGSVNGYAKGVYVEGSYGILLINANGSTFTIVDSDLSSAYSYTIANSDSAGFILYDKISFNMNVVDEDGSPIDSATVLLYDVDGTLVINTTTDSNGDITEQYVTRNLITQIAGTGPGKYTTSNRYPFRLVVTKTGYQNYDEDVSYDASYGVVKTVALTPLGGQNATHIYDSTLYDCVIY